MALLARTVVVMTPGCDASRRRIRDTYIEEKSHTVNIEPGSTNHSGSSATALAVKSTLDAACGGYRLLFNVAVVSTA